MRIAQIAPLFETVPPTAYGGTERVIAGLCNELTRAGHEVTLFAAGGSCTEADLVEVVPQPLRSTMTRQQMIEVSPHLHLRMLTEVFALSDEFDVIHAHTDIWTLPFLEHSTTPVVITMHGRLDIDTVLQILPLYQGAPLVSISDAQRLPTGGMDVNWVGTVYNGLDLSTYTVDRPREYLAFVGRISAEKRPDWAVEVATKVGLPLRVAAKIDPLDTDYWEQYIKPLFEAHDVDFIGEISESEKPDFYGGAIATLFPIDWPEPFGLVMIESMAAGTPVLALDRGSVPEVIEHGVSGLISADLDEMIRSVAHLETLDPRRCRATAQRFSARAMSRRYLSVYRKVLADARPTVLNVPPRRPSTTRFRRDADLRDRPLNTRADADQGKWKPDVWEYEGVALVAARIAGSAVADALVEEGEGLLAVGHVDVVTPALQQQATLRHEPSLTRHDRAPPALARSRVHDSSSERIARVTPVGFVGWNQIAFVSFVPDRIPCLLLRGVLTRRSGSTRKRIGSAADREDRCLAEADSRRPY